MEASMGVNIQQSQQRVEGVEGGHHSLVWVCHPAWAVSGLTCSHQERGSCAWQGPPAHRWGAAHRGTRGRGACGP